MYLSILKIEVSGWRKRMGARAGLLFLLAGVLFLSQILPVQASQTWEERVTAQRERVIESNEVNGWPKGPVVTADSAILMEAGTGTILYAKNIHQHQYPASCTKILTCLIAAERCGMDETVTMSHKAIYDTPLDSSYISLDVGNKITMEEALNAVLVCSANNVAYAVAEHVVDSDWEDFAPVMNERARELGCVDSNFVNPNGLPDENHYTSAYDLAMIGRAFFDNELLCKISRTARLHLPPTDTQPKDILENSSNRLLPGKSMAYEYIVGSKTGYTNAARSCLVSCAEKDGFKLICVVLKDESPSQFEDTLALFEYGFNNFGKINVSDAETRYQIRTNDDFYSSNDIFGNSRPLLKLNEEDYLVLPNTAIFSDTVSSISFDTETENQVALISYTYSGVPVGTASVDFVTQSSDGYDFEEPESSNSMEAGDKQAGISQVGSENEGGSQGDPENPITTGQNSENKNTGNKNTGNKETGSQNTGKQNIGNQNTGNQNTGSQNTGNQNTGSQNTGGKESGNQDSGEEPQIIFINLKEALLWTAIVLAVMALAAILIKLVRIHRAAHPRRQPGQFYSINDNPYLTVSEDLRKRRKAAAKNAREHRRRAKRSH